jgi:hypothetical protein
MRTWVDDWTLDDDTQIPHCDSRILHRPGDCIYCDRHPLAQLARYGAKVYFTGDLHVMSDPAWIPCPADAARPPGSSSDHRRWGGNKPTSATGDPAWPAESVASVLMYGDKGGRVRWPLPERIRRRAGQPFVNLRYRWRGYRHVDGMWIYSSGSRPGWRNLWHNPWRC